MKKTNAQIIMIIVVAIWAASFALTKQVLNELDVFNFMAMRFLIGWVALTLFLLIAGKRKVPKEQLIGGLITGAVLFLAFTFHTIGLKYTTVAKNAFIVGGSVLFVPIIATCVKGQKQSRVIWFCTSLALLGLGFVTLDGKTGGPNFGDFITFLGSVVMGYYIILVEEYVKKGDASIIAAIQIGVVGILSLIVSIFIETPTAILSINGWQSMLFLGVICSAIAYAIANIAQKHIPASNIALIYTLEPIFAAILGWIVLSEILGLQAVIGGVLIVVSVILPNVKTDELRFNNKELVKNTK